MEGKANFSIKNVDNADKESFDMNYQITDCGNIENLKEIKKELDTIVESKGGLVSVKLENKPETTAE